MCQHCHLAAVAHEYLVLMAGSEEGAFRIWKGPDLFHMTGGTADGAAEDDAQFFPPTKAATLLELFRILATLPGWIPIPYFGVVYANPDFCDDLDAACRALWPEPWAKRRHRWLNATEPNAFVGPTSRPLKERAR